MDTYVKVGSDLQLAVRYIMQSKKAFLQQSRCVKELSKQNDLLQQKVKELEMNNKELRALSLLVKQNQTLKERVLGLTTTSSRKKRERVLDDILKCDDNTFSVSEDYTSQPNNNVTSSDINSTGDEEDMRHCPESCPKSPIKKKKISPNKFETPSKKKRKVNDNDVEGNTTVQNINCDSSPTTRRQLSFDTGSPTGSGFQNNQPRRSLRVKGKASHHK